MAAAAEEGSLAALMLSCYRESFAASAGVVDLAAGKEVGMSRAVAREVLAVPAAVASGRRLVGCKMVDSACMRSSAVAWALADAADVEEVRDSSLSVGYGLGAAPVWKRVVICPAA